MNLLKRFELWVLLAVILAGLWFVFSPGDSGADGMEDAGSGSSAAGGSAPAPLHLHRVGVERDYGNVRLDLDVRVRHEGTDKLTMQPPEVRLVSGSGREIPPFFLPFEPQPEISPGATQDVQLRYWLEAADLQNTLTLKVGERSLVVKSATPLDVETLKNGEKQTFTSAEWPGAVQATDRR